MALNNELSTPYVGLLRAINVGGTGRLAMSRLKAACEALGFLKVSTYLAAGNVLFMAAGGENAVKSQLQDALTTDLGASVQVLIRTAPQMAAVLAANPFTSSPPAQTVAIFLDQPPPTTFLNGVAGLADEMIAAGEREIYVCYPSGIGRSKLTIPAAKAGTARNFNTIAKLATLAASLS